MTDARGFEGFREDDAGAFHQKVHLSMVVTAVLPGRLAVLRRLCRDSVVVVYVAGGEVVGTALQSWN